jgi:uncharacterized membrane-anchored protein
VGPRPRARIDAAPGTRIAERPRAPDRVRLNPPPDRITIASPRRSKVPTLTLIFWVITLLASAVGETTADLVSGKLELGLTDAAWIMVALLGVALIVQLRCRSYVPGAYWSVVVLMAVVGTLVADDLVDERNVAAATIAAILAVAVVATLAVWYWFEQTISMRSIDTSRREAFYWVALLFVFALGTAISDLIATEHGLGFWQSALVFAALIGLVAIGHFWFRLPEVVAFWLAYVLTRALGVATGDYLSAPRDAGGLGRGIAATIVILLIIAGLVVLSGAPRVSSALRRRTRMESSARSR